MSLMLRRTAQWVLVVLFLTPAAGYAAPATWEFGGTLQQVDGTPGVDWPEDFTIGTPYRVIVQFDTSASVFNTRAGTGDGTQTGLGSRYLLDAGAVRVAVYMGTSCAPCVPSNAIGYDWSNANTPIIVRDNFDDTLRNGVAGAFDGISFQVETPDGITVAVIARGLVTDLINGPTLPASPDPRLPGLAVHVFQACNSAGNCVAGPFDTVTVPTSGSGYLLTSRECRIPARTGNRPNGTPFDTFPYDCVNGGGIAQQAWSFPPQLETGGGVGVDSWSWLQNPLAWDIDGIWQNGGFHSINGYSNAPLGTVFGSVAFNGPVGLPVLKGSSFPADISRTASNLYGFARYRYAGAATSLPLQIAVDYTLSDNRVAIPTNDLSLQPGVAVVNAFMAIVDGSITADQINAAAKAFSAFSIDCGAEAALGWPAGSILGSARHRSEPGAQGLQVANINLLSCSYAADGVTRLPLTLSANQSFSVVSALQAVARGSAAQPPDTVTAPANGWADAANTMKVVFDPAAPRAVVQALSAAIVPDCTTNCDAHQPEPVAVRVELRPGEHEKCIEANDDDPIRAVVYGSSSFAVADLRTDSTLHLGSLGLAVRGRKAACSVRDMDADGIPDLRCDFANQSLNWKGGPTTVALQGKLYTGVPVEGVAKVCYEHEDDHDHHD